MQAANTSTSQDENDPTFVSKKRNPIIFARTETTHIPQNFQKSDYNKELHNTVYQAQNDGTLKPIQLESIDETSEDALSQDNRPLGFWKRIFLLCWPKRIDNIMDIRIDVHKPLVDTTEETTIVDVMSIEQFLGDQRPKDKGKKTLVLDLDETLVHSTFQPTQNCQFVIPVEIEGNVYNVYVYLRPGACEFLATMSKIFEIVIYTASLRKYADPLLDKMDPEGHISYRLFRDHCVCSDGVFVKDLGLLGRDLKNVIMIDNAAMSFKFQPKNGIECTAFIDDFSDQELEEMTPFLEYLAKKSDVRAFAKLWNDARDAQTQMVTYDK